MTLTQLVALTSAALAQSKGVGTNDVQKQPADLTSMNLEQLMNIQVTTQSKQPETLSKVPAAVFVVTQEDIRRSGATNIPEALRMVPGVQVSQQDASKYIVSIRGMGSRYADKLLVLVDGRTVYTPLFSGVYWDAQDIDLDQVDRIEVIRGPGGTLWGANAVNGIINIITKSASQTLGNRGSIETSSAEPYALSVSHGGLIPDGAFRVYARAYDSVSLPPTIGQGGNNQWDGMRGGVRSDWNVKGSSFTFTSDVNSSHQGQTFLVPTLTAPYEQVLDYRYVTSEWYAQGKWEKTEGADKGTAVRMSFDHYDRGTPDIGERNNEFAIDIQKPLATSRQHQFIGGLGYNVSTDQAFATPYVTTTSPSRTTTVYSAFVHDEIHLKDTLALSLGTKLENNSFTGWELQPSARLLYSPKGAQTYWVAVSRAVRTPARDEIDSRILAGAEAGPGGIPVAEYYLGNPGFKSETVITSELGWRDQPSERFFLDATTFYSHYGDLQGGVLDGIANPTLATPYFVGTGSFANNVSADTAGIELAGHYAAAKHWNLDASYSLYSERYSIPPGLVGGEAASGDGVTPHHMASIRSQLDLPRRMEFDVTGYYVSSIEFQNIAAYARLDMRFGWKTGRDNDFSVGVTNLTSERHVEATTLLFDVASSVERSVYARATFHF